MKSTEPSTTPVRVETKKVDSCPFFPKEGEGGVFALEKSFFAFSDRDSFFKPQLQPRSSFIQKQTRNEQEGVSGGGTKKKCFRFQ